MSSTSDLPYAAFHQRLGCFLVDWVARVLLIFIFVFAVARPIIIAVLVPQGVPSGHLDPRALWAAADASQKAVVVLLFFVSIWIPSGLYYAALESSSRRATLGKIALGLVTVRTDGSRVSFLRAAARYFVKAFVTVVPFGFVAMLLLFGVRRQAPHDWVTGVVVVRRGKVEAVRPVGTGVDAT